jgi:peptidoglycan/xylan/chitin deacetylase (PgdA/CDA1 family)
MSRPRVPLLLYHSVTSRPDPRFREWAVSPELFAAHMSHLAEQGYRTLTVRELVERAFEQRRPLEPRTVVITFDDGFADFYSAAWPELRKHGLAATIFITTGYVGRASAWLASMGEGDRPMLTWSQIEEISSAGIECGAHGHHHLQLDTVPAARAEADVRRSKELLDETAGPVTSFAYPHGYYTRRVQRLVADAGFSAACGVKDALSTSDDDRFALARVVVRGGTGVDRLARVLRGEDTPVVHGKRTLRRGAWRALRRAGAEPVVQRLAAARPRARGAV